MVNRSNSAKTSREDSADGGGPVGASASPISVPSPTGLFLRVEFCRVHVSRHDGVAEDTREEENILDREFAADIIKEIGGGYINSGVCLREIRS